MSRDRVGGILPFTSPSPPNEPGLVVYEKGAWISDSLQQGVWKRFVKQQAVLYLTIVKPVTVKSSNNYSTVISPHRLPLVAPEPILRTWVLSLSH
ncbi:hypothetical protein TNCT_408731 [Trichonephila clavata]|uniref:Uncharacterized protein n=1 Tax=Trichonephila clavata TaxID=2740835 RepID=A0A8X6M066_TRICU|nr:hypothetical protein TNCT_408731 [Trichonephila clavata]